MKKSIIFLLHIIYWLLYVFLLLIILLCMRIGTGAKTFSFFDADFLRFIFFFAVIPAVWGFYIFYNTLFASFLKKKKIVALFAVGLLSSVTGGMIGAAAIAIFFPRINLFTEGFISAGTITLIMAIITLFNGGMGLIIKAFISWYGDIRLKEELNRKNHETELALVKSQLDPHFLFNTINNIDILIEDDPQKASAYLNSLSVIMRFMLYETKTGKIELRKELDYIEKYIALQKIRFADPAYVNYHAEGDCGHIRTEPMLFIPFIENAFKHSGHTKKGNCISIFIRTDKERIVFQCENVFSNHCEKTEEFSGLGDDLIRRRLQLLYPGNHSLKITVTSDIYRVDLTIDHHEN